jgi:hypothetical protein
MFTLEIDKRAVAVTNADKIAASDLLMGESFKADMRRWECDGAPVWDGESQFNLREAAPAEAEKFEKAEHKLRRRVGEDGPLVMFLIDAHDPDDVEED